MLEFGSKLNNDSDLKPKAPVNKYQVDLEHCKQYAAGVTGGRTTLLQSQTKSITVENQGNTKTISTTK